jgi:ABC-type lipoprotein release transport system permease subunit
MINAIFLVLIKHLKAKWVRVLLAQAGIMIGIWAISLTTSLSFGLSDKVISIINSQASAKEIQLYKVEGDKTSFFDLQSVPKFILTGEKDIQNLKNTNSNIVDIAPQTGANAVVHTSKNADHTFNCVNETVAAQSSTGPQSGFNGFSSSLPQEPSAKQQEIQAKCTNLYFNISSWQSHINNYNQKIIGEKRKPNRGEISICYKCGAQDFGKTLGFTSPQDMLGKEIVVEFTQSIDFGEAGKVVDPQESGGVIQTKRDHTTTKQVKLKVISVVDDSKDEVNIFLGGGNIATYIDFSHYIDEVQRIKPEVKPETIAFTNYTVTVNDYTSLEPTINQLKSLKYLTFSPILELVNGIQLVFTALTYFLAGFGLIVLISSVFGIINVMTISVLERQKEIGILKSLGANNTHIFWMFLLESMVLGCIGWLFGTLLAVGSGLAISRASIWFLQQNSQWRENLLQFNITDFNPSFPPLLLASTFALSVFFTTISGLIPAIRASRQHIVEVLRAE